MSEIVHSAHLSALPLPVARGAVVASGAPALAAAGWEGTRYRMDENLTAMEVRAASGSFRLCQSRACS